MEELIQMSDGVESVVWMLEEAFSGFIFLNHTR